MEKNGILLAGKKIIKGLLVGSIVLSSAQADFLMTLTDKNGVEESLCVKSYSFSNNLESLRKKVNQKDIYSTEETLTNKVFLGKPVYRKVAKMPSLVANNTWTITYYDNPPTNVEKLLTAELMMRDLSGYSQTGSSTHYLVYEIRTNYIGYRIGTDIGSNFKDPYILLEYTKTTGTAQTNPNELTTLVHYLPSKSTDGEYITKSMDDAGIRFQKNYTYDASTNSCIAPTN
ncbi:hypothetical protein [Arcobacter sp.]|uniref:hypothetical protein n=1 Tax=unclassified Arcobacter TaxID=2593671 RepID=UPI003AFF8C64